MGKSQREKGARFERWVANYLNDFDYPAHRGQQFSGGKDSPDVVSPEFPLHIEAKAVERLDLYGAMTQSIRDAGDKPPCVIHKKNNHDVLVTCKLEDFLNLITKNNDER